MSLLSFSLPFAWSAILALSVFDIYLHQDNATKALGSSSTHAGAAPAPLHAPNQPTDQDNAYDTDDVEEETQFLIAGRRWHGVCEFFATFSSRLDNFPAMRSDNDEMITMR